MRQDELERTIAASDDFIEKNCALKASDENWFRALVEYSTDHIFMLNKEGEYLFSNNRTEKCQAFRDNTLIGKKLEEVHPKDLSIRYSRVVTSVFNYGNVTSFEYELEKTDGPHFYIETLYPIYKEGAPWAVGGICRDITTRKRYEKELQNKTNELEKALKELHQTQRRIVDQERQRALSQMASGIAHDFNNALTSIQGFSDLLLQTPEKMSDAATVKKYITLINDSARSAAQVVRRLRKFYRPSDDEIVGPVDINNLIEEAIALTEPVWKSNAQTRGAFINIKKKLDDHVVINGNRTELHEAITNLIFNAVDAMPKGGTLGFFTKREDDWITIEINDNGIGMDETVREQCLSPFYTTKGEAGSGLGLATVQGVITRHRGEISIHSKPGRGTSFTLRLPAAARTKPTAVTAEPLENDLPSLKILLVDDDENQRVLLKAFLRKDNHRTETAANGVDGMKKFNSNWYDLIITDRAMPELNGDDLARNIKKVAPGKPVIMLTGFGDIMDEDKKTPGIADLIISKPVSLEGLRKAIKQVLSKRRPEEE